MALSPAERRTALARRKAWGELLAAADAPLAPELAARVQAIGRRVLEDVADDFLARRAVRYDDAALCRRLWVAGWDIVPRFVHDMSRYRTCAERDFNDLARSWAADRRAEEEDGVEYVYTPEKIGPTVSRVSLDWIPRDTPAGEAAQRMADLLCYGPPVAEELTLSGDDWEAQANAQRASVLAAIDAL